MFKRILFTLALLVSAPSFAGSCAQQINQVSGLSDSVAQEMIVQCEQAKLAATQQVVPDADKINAYAEVARAVAEAIGVAAKELGVAVNDFIVTPAGMLTAGIILWKFVGATLVSAFIAIMAGVCLSVLCTYFRKRVLFKGYINVQDAKGNGKVVPEYFTWKEASDGQVFFLVVSYILQVIAILVIGVNAI